ncbi:uncharacterized protein EV420DRAFT_1477019 [Desarmillaria tabescens]|uniref:Uncharacterized protein n=1 Tax=Armillaria tabescens TaxID=1929756 RepID=A0AA39TKH3_ARMTA|nr:uncharacterized protein EV420DRAFT_1477019 [Desarmillaria tabescens]KAK0462267.1 hypothetical protein EV420DRAFT_1477019 [Desarmillaria tabescens]
MAWDKDASLLLGSSLSILEECSPHLMLETTPSTAYKADVWVLTSRHEFESKRKICGVRDGSTDGIRELEPIASSSGIPEGVVSTAIGENTTSTWGLMTSKDYELDLEYQVSSRSSQPNYQVVSSSGIPGGIAQMAIGEREHNINLEFDSELDDELELEYQVPLQSSQPVYRG